MKELFKRNYDAVVKRGLILPDTTDKEFWGKAMEELDEIYDEPSSDEEWVDLMNVCICRCIHRGVDIEQILIRIAEKNENRSKTVNHQ